MKILHAILFSDFKNRMLALSLAVVTWVSVYRESTEQVKATAQVDLALGADVVVLSIEDETGAPCTSIEVTLNGPRGERSRLRDLKLSRSIDVPATGGTPFIDAFDVTEDVLLLPPKFKLVSAKPARVRVKVDRRVRRFMPLAATRDPAPGEVRGIGLVQGKPAEGVHVKSAVVSPSALFVQGPESVLASHAAIAVVPVKIDGLPPGRYQLAAEIPATLDGVPVSTASSIFVTVELAEEPQEAVFTVKVNMIQSEAYAKDFIAESGVKEAEVRVRGPVSAITELKARPELLMVYVDITAMRPEECQPIDDKPLNATRPMVAEFRAKFAGSDDVEVTFRKTEKPETTMTFLRRQPPK